jgi:hypothetical protein
MQHRLYNNCQETAEPEFILKGFIPSASSGGAVLKLGNRIFVYEDTDGETFIDFREAEAVIDIAPLMDGSEADIGG